MSLIFVLVELGVWLAASRPRHRAGQGRPRHPPFSRVSFVMEVV